MQQARKEWIDRSIDYILQNLDENLTVKKVAEQFHYSEFYFGRIFKEETGKTVHAFIQQLKLEQSAIDLKLKRGRSITDIGLDYGYTASNYSSAFKNHFSFPPVQFRMRSGSGRTVNPFYPERTDIFATYDAYQAKVRIDELPELTVLYERMIGDYSEIKETWLKLINGYSRYLHAGTWMIEKFYDDPSLASHGSCICDLCIPVGWDCELPNVAAIKGGTVAVYPFEEKIADIFCAVQGFFSVWLPNSGYEMAERYGLNIYRKIDLNSDFVVMDVCIPIK